jgi:hypothetical protein
MARSFSDRLEQAKSVEGISALVDALALYAAAGSWTNEQLSCSELTGFRA